MKKTALFTEYWR